MSQKVMTGISRLNLGIFSVFFGLWLVAFNNHDLTFNFLIGMTVGMTIAALIVFSGLRGLKHFRAELHDKSLLKKLNFALIPNVLGFVIMGISVYLLSIFRLEPFTLPDGNVGFYYLHPYSSQSETLFFGGLGIEALAAGLYYYFMPKQIVQEQEASPKPEAPLKA